MTPAFVRDLMGRTNDLYVEHSKKADQRRYAAEPEPMTDFGGFDRRAQPPTCIDALKSDPNVDPDFAAALPEPYIGSKQEYYDDIRREFIESERDGDSDVRDDE